jgi:hypothetical protein
MTTHRIISVLFITAVIGSTARTQDCTLFFPADEGTVIESEHYDKKDKLTGSTMQEIISKEVSGNSSVWTIRSTIKDENGEGLMESEMSFECRDGVFYYDMNNYLKGESMSALESMEFTIEGDNLEFPPDMKEGDILKDGQVRLTVDQMPVMNTTTTIMNRKVEAIEEVTTPAGTFECYKISYDIETKMMMTLRASGIEWIAKDVGVVRSESYNKKGKLTGYTVLSRLEK